MLAAVFGPTHPKSSRDEVFDELFLSVNLVYGTSTTSFGSLHVGSGDVKRSDDDKEGSIFLHSCLKPVIKCEIFPRKYLLVTVNVIHNDGAGNL